MSSWFGPLGPGRRPEGRENSIRYFRFFNTLCSCSKVEGLKPMAERSMRVGRMNKVHKPAMMRSVARRLGARLRPTKDEQLVSDQHRFGNDGTDSSRPGQPRQGDDQMNE